MDPTRFQTLADRFAYDAATAELSAAETDVRGVVAETKAYVAGLDDLGNEPDAPAADPGADPLTLPPGAGLTR